MEEEVSSDGAAGGGGRGMERPSFGLSESDLLEVLVSANQTSTLTVAGTFDYLQTDGRYISCK